jgi:hypothetical protein
MDKAFGKTDQGLSLFSSAVNYIYGGGGVVTNFFSIDADSSRIYMAATAPDAEDGTEDGRSELGAIYVLDLIDDGNGGFKETKGIISWISSKAEFTPKTVETASLRTDLVYRLRILVDGEDVGLNQGQPVTIKLHKMTNDDE